MLTIKYFEELLLNAAKEIIYTEDPQHINAIFFRQQAEFQKIVPSAFLPSLSETKRDNTDCLGNLGTMFEDFMNSVFRAV